MRILALLVTLWVPAQAMGQRPDSAIRLARIGGARISAVYDVIAAPPYAYALERHNLYVLDVREPRVVREVARLELQEPRLWGFIYGSGLYLGGFGRSLAVVDVSDPRNPRWVGADPDVPVALGARVIDGRLYVMEPGPPLTLSVMQPSEAVGFPTRLASLAIERERGQRLSGFSYDAGRLYVLLERPRSIGTQLLVVDIEKPTQPSIERRIALPRLWDYRRAVVRGDLAYVTMADSNEAFGLATLHLGDAKAELLGSVTDRRLWNGGRMILNGDAVYVTYKYAATVATFDVSDPRTPRLADAFIPADRTSSGLGFSRVGDRLYVAGDAGESVILDISTPLAPRRIGGWQYDGGWARDVTLHGSEAVVHNWGFGFFIYDVQDPASPSLLGSYLTSKGDGADHLALEDNRVLLSHGAEVSELVDIGDPASPTVVLRYAVPEAVAAGALRFPHAIQAYRAGGLGIVDLTAPDRPPASVDLNGVASDLKVQAGLAVVGHTDGGVSVVDVTNPERPALVGRAAGPITNADVRGALTRVAISPDGARAFTLYGLREEEDTTVTVSVFEIRPSSVRRVGSLDVPFAGFAQDYTILGGEDEIVIGAGSDIVRIDIRQPASPTIKARYRTSANIERLAMQGRLIVVAASEDGMQIFELPPL